MIAKLLILGDIKYYRRVIVKKQKPISSKLVYYCRKSADVKTANLFKSFCKLSQLQNS